MIRAQRVIRATASAHGLRRDEVLPQIVVDRDHLGTSPASCVGTAAAGECRTDLHHSDHVAIRGLEHSRPIQ